MLKKLLAMVAASVMMLSCFGGVVQAEYEYAWGETIAYEGAPNGSSVYEDATDSTTNKRIFMDGINTKNANNETAATYYSLFDSYVKNTTCGTMRLSNGNSNQVFFKTKGTLLTIDGASVKGKNFYSTSDKLYARFGFIDSGVSSSASVKKVASTMTYEFDVQYNNNFFTTYGYVSTGFSGSYSNRAIRTVMIKNNGDIYATGSNFDGSNPVKIGSLKLGEKYTISVTIKLVPSTTANKSNYEITVYIDGDKKYNVVGSDLVSTSTKFHGFEMDFYPWTVNKEFDTSNISTDVYYGQTSLGGGKYNYCYMNETVTNEYTVLDTVATISDFYVYAGDKYAQDAPSFADANKKFHITSNVRKDTNYVTVAADAGTATAAKAILATYNGEKLVNVKTQDLTLSAAAITETDIELTNAGATSKKLFILDGLGNLKPLAADTVLN